MQRVNSPLWLEVQGGSHPGPVHESPAARSLVQSRPGTGHTLEMGQRAFENESEACLPSLACLACVFGCLKHTHSYSGAVVPHPHLQGKTSEKHRGVHIQGQVWTHSKGAIKDASNYVSSEEQRPMPSKDLSGTQCD